MFTLNCKGKLFVLDRPKVMGILNLTPDSFYAGSRLNSVDAALTQAEKMLENGASIIDIGGQSTHPDSQPVSAEEELFRVIDPIEAIARRFPEAIISIDSYYSAVASEAVAAGASIINDISAGKLDPAIIATAAKLGVPYIAMHMKGSPQTMKQQAHYDDICLEIMDYFIERLGVFRETGIKDIILDPGFGFAKTIAQNFELLKKLRQFELLSLPVLVGLSRKSTIYKTLRVSPEESLNGTTALNMVALINGARILRVHDVKEAVELITLYSEIYSK